MSDTSFSLLGLRRQPRQARSQERVNRILQVAQALFVSEGYSTTTTNQIAAQANVPIGSLYQFFPDKAAILQALAVHYTAGLRQHLAAQWNALEAAESPLSACIDQLTDAAHQFFMDNPGYHAIFMEAQGTVPELAEIDQAFDMQLIQDWSAAFAKRNPALTQEDCDTIGFVTIKAMGNLLWLSLSQKPEVRQRLVAETKRLSLNYLQDYFPKDEISPSTPSENDGGKRGKRQKAKGRRQKQKVE